MASVGQIPACISALHERLCDDIGGHFHSANQAYHATLSLESRLRGDAAQLKAWMGLCSKQETDPLDRLFEEAIQGWIQKENKQQKYNQKRVTEWMRMVEQRPTNRPESIFMANQTIEEFSQPPAFVEVEDEFVCIDDGAVKQIALLNKWKKQPSAVFEAVPRIKAAFGYLKAKQEAE